MIIYLISLAVLLGISSIVVFMLSFYSGKALKRIILNAVFGILIMAGINLTSKFSGVHIPINPVTALGIGIFSIPAVIGFLMLNIIFL
ncbi:MAG: pro-sigmaK processing inhibitor BofA family protein [Clostridia bacterium]|nr:pro-sigmaK processing inhibitor BofA family protein [Clostridia bacterium]